VERVRKQVAEAVKQAAQKGQGSVPGGWARWADETLEPAKVRWQDKLSRSVRNAMAYRAGAVDTTYKKLSRRQWGCGVGAGKPMMAALHAPKPNIAVVVDTSGSMGDAEVMVALREGKGIMDAAGAKVTFVACDARVHSLKVVRDWKEMAALLKGGGGTDFRPAFEALAKSTPRPDIIVFVTDGHGTAPAVAPMGVKVIWVLVGQGTRKPATWGDVVEVEVEK
jgi:predicted metal-dependent peptidase